MLFLKKARLAFIVLLSDILLVKCIPTYHVTLFKTPIICTHDSILVVLFTNIQKLVCPFSCLTCFCKSTTVPDIQKNGMCKGSSS